MNIETLRSPSGKIAELCSGVDGSGNTIFCLQWLKVVYTRFTMETVGCYHIDQFKTEAEARAYFSATA